MTTHSRSPARYRRVVVPAVICIVMAALSLYECTFHHVGLDQGGWTYAGWAWEAHGLAPYSGTMDNKTPGIHMLYALSVRQFGISIWPHAVAAAIALIVTALLIYLLALRLHDEAAGTLTMLLFALTVTTPSLNGSLYVEPFVAMFATAAFFLILTPRGATAPAGSRRLFLAGASMGLALLFKQTALFAALALCIASGVLDRQRSGRIVTAVRGVAIILLGMALVTLLSLMPLLASGTTLRQYWDGAWILLLKPGTAAKLTNRIYNFVCVWGGIHMKLPLFYPMLLLFILQRKRLLALAVPCGCLLVWLGLTFLGANASGQLWGHQVQEVLPALTVVSGIGLAATMRTVFVRKPQRRACLSWTLAAICLLWAPIDLFDATCQRIHMRAKGEVPSPDKRKLLGLWLKDHISASDPIFIWSRDTGAIYAYAEKVAPSRFFHNHFAGNADVVAEIQAALRRQPPQYVLIEKIPYPPTPSWLQEWIDRNYTLQEERFGYLVLKRMQSP